MAPARVIQGQLTRLSRTTHGIAYDATHDEIIAPNPLAAAVVIFRGGAAGEEPPARTIQGAGTGLSRPETVAVDEKNNEIIVGDPGDRRVLVYRRDADGNAAPTRTIQGPKTLLLQVVGVAVDPGRDLLVVSTYSRLPGGVTGVLIFGRTDQGDVAPRRVIAGPRTGITRLRQIALDPETGKIYVANFGDHTALVFPRLAAGNVRPRRIIRNAPAGKETSGFGNPYSVAYDTKRQEILVPN